MNEAPRYDASFAFIRAPLVGSFERPLCHTGFRDALLDLSEVVEFVRPTGWFLTRSDTLVEAQLRLSRSLQCESEYSRARISAPARTFREEQMILGSVGVAGPSVDLVMGFSGIKHKLELVEALETALSKGGRHSLTFTMVDEPDAIQCHTSLNQRLLRPNLELCQWFSTCLVTCGRLRREIGSQFELGLSVAAFRIISARAGLQAKHQAELLTFGRQYLAAYMEIPDALLGVSSSAEEQVQTLDRFEQQARTTCAQPLEHDLALEQPDWLARHLDSGWFFFPESMWMQFHWFNWLIGLDLLRELALVEAMVCATQAGWPHE